MSVCLFVYSFVCCQCVLVSRWLTGTCTLLWAATCSGSNAWTPEHWMSHMFLPPSKTFPSPMKLMLAAGADCGIYECTRCVCCCVVVSDLCITVWSRLLRFLAGSTNVACFFRVCWFFLCCLRFGLCGYFAGPCLSDAYVEELVSTKTSCFRTH